MIHGDVKGVRATRMISTTHADAVMTQANILVDGAGNARIVDFGLATIARDTNSLQSTSEHHGNTPRFTAPEILRDIATHSKESDIFAFGMVVIEVGGN